MHRCSSSHGNMVGGPCSCGMFNCQSNSFSMLFSMPNHHHHHKSFDHEITDMYYPLTSPSSSSSSVDCTLSLGTPSTRLCEDDEKRIRQLDHQRGRSSSSCMSNFRWDTLQPKNTTTPYNAPVQTHKSTSRSGNSNSGNSNNNMANNDPLLARRCANCDTTSTPLWRNGPRGPKSLCNACGIRFKKEERRATAANVSASGGAMEQQQQQHYGYHHQNNNSSWVQTTQKMACFSPAANEFRFINEDSDNRDSDHTGIPNFLSWRLNVTDRPTQLVHDFTRY